MTKIVHLQYGASAASPANRLDNAFRKVGMDSKIVCLYAERTAGPNVTTLGRKAKWISKINNWVQEYLTRNINTSFGGFSFAWVGSDVSSLKEVREADIIYVHWILNGFLSLKSLDRLAGLGKPLIFVMHDMWTITGGCHHSFECDKYTGHCGSCQLFGNTKRKDLAYTGFEKKLKLFARHDNLHFVSPSNWLYQKAKSGKLLHSKSIYHIPNVLDRDLYKPIDKGLAKYMLNIEPDEKVVAFGAMSVTSPYKGWKYLKQALDKLGQLELPYRIRLLVFGANGGMLTESVSFKTKDVGYIDNEYATALMYNAADVFVAPSVADNLPYAVLESESCATPVVAFDVGGMPEMIVHKENGYLAKYMDSNDLVNGIRYCLEKGLIGKSLQGYGFEEIIDKHRKLIRSALTGHVLEKV